ncbi:MAG: proline reductase-associated electron transfer protein PrdC [Spirochaetaceae bacterium]|nr:proline reductase-associated electron transfer protein PrdC [Spirochaetaceae bacterium]
MALSYRLMLSQSIGAPAVPLNGLTVGSVVKRGTLLAVPEGLGVPLHASVSGVIAAITADYIDITADEKQDTAFEPISKSDDIAEMVKSAGLCGMGGAGFPTYVKLQSNLNGGVVIINAVECEPLLKHNIKQLTEQPEKVYRGLLLAMQATKAGRGILAVKSKNSEAIKAFRAVLRSGDNITIKELPDMYPMGDERAVIREALDNLLAVDQLPAAAGAVVLNLETVCRITEAVDERKPVISKNLTVAGKLGKGREPYVFMDVPIGTPFSALIAERGGIIEPYGEIINGGPFTGVSATPDTVVTKTTGGILVPMEILQEKRPLGLLVCACSAGLPRLQDIAQKMGAKVVSTRACKQAKDVKGVLKCENPGNCPGQAEKILAMKKEGIEALLISTCSDCSNTVMGVAPKLKLGVHHITDHVMRTAGLPLIRRLPIE